MTKKKHKRSTHINKQSIITKEVSIVLVTGLLTFLGFAYIPLNVIYIQKKTRVMSTIPLANNDKDTETWNILTNSWGFSIRYPSTYEARGDGLQADPSRDETINLIDPKESNNIYKSIYIDVSNKDETVFKDKSLETIVKNDFSSSTGKIISPISQTTLNDFPAYTYSVLDNGITGKYEGITLIKDQNKKNIKVIESEYQHKRFLIIYIATPLNEKIISTFKFIRK